MIRRLITASLLSILAIASACAVASPAEEEHSSAVATTPPNEALESSSKLYDQRDELDKVRKAIEVLEGARNPDARNYEVEAAFAKYSYFLGSRKEVEDAEAGKILKNGLSAARIASRLEPGKPDGHFWAAAILGEQSKRAPMTVGLVSVDKIRAGMLKVVEIDPGFQASSAYLGLGQLELNTRGLAGGDIDKAIEYLEKGFEASKDNVYFYVYLAEAYFAVDKDDEAKKLIRDLEMLNPNPEFEPEYKDAMKIAEKLMKNKS